MDPSDEQSTVLEAALGAFLAYGFHAVTLAELEAATGESWDSLTQRFGDKEALFLLAAEQGLADGSIAAFGKEREVLEMLARLERVNGNPRLRAIHKQSLARVRTIAEEQAGSIESREGT